MPKCKKKPSKSTEIDTDPQQRDVFVKVFCFLDPAEIFSLKAVCKLWAHYTQFVSWKEVYTRLWTCTERRNLSNDEWKALAVERFIYERGNQKQLRPKLLHTLQTVESDKDIHKQTEKILKCWNTLHTAKDTLSLYVNCGTCGFSGGGLFMSKKKRERQRKDLVELNRLRNSTYYRNIHWANQGSGGISGYVIQDMKTDFVIYTPSSAIPRYFTFTYYRQGWNDDSMPNIVLRTSYRPLVLSENDEDEDVDSAYYGYDFECSLPGWVSDSRADSVSRRYMTEGLLMKFVAEGRNEGMEPFGKQEEDNEMLRRGGVMRPDWIITKKDHTKWKDIYKEIYNWLDEDVRIAELMEYLLHVSYAPTGWKEPSMISLKLIDVVDFASVEK